MLKDHIPSYNEIVTDVSTDYPYEGEPEEVVPCAFRSERVKNVNESHHKESYQK